MERLLTQLVDRLKKALRRSPEIGDPLRLGRRGRPSREVLGPQRVCVLADVTPRELGESTAIVRWWREKGNPSPLLLTEEEIRDSSDCFPIEFHDIPGAAPRALRRGFRLPVSRSISVLPRLRSNTTCGPSCCGFVRERLAFWGRHPAPHPAGGIGLDLLRAVPARAAVATASTRGMRSAR